MPTRTPPGMQGDQLVSVPADRPYLLIVPKDDGFVSVRGPLNNPGLCYNWLQQAFVYVLLRSIRMFGLTAEGGAVDLEGKGGANGAENQIVP